MLKGFLRLSVVLSVLALVPITIFLIKDSHRYLALGINPHLGLPRFSFGPFETDWCAIAASPAFLEKSEPERLALADSFFREKIEPLAADAYIDTESFRAKFVNTATLSLDEVPIETC